MIAKKQHIIPQFIQRNFATDVSKKKVRIYLVKENKFVDTRIKLNMQKAYFYGKSGKYENILAREVESKAAPIIQQMIKNPKKYMRKNPKLDQIMLTFVIVSRQRTEKTQKVLKDISSSLIEYSEKYLKSNNKQLEMVHRFNDDWIESQELMGKVSLLEPDDRSTEEIFNGKYMLFESKTSIFCSDIHAGSIIPLSPFLALIYGDLVDHFNKYLFNVSNVLVVNFINSFLLKHTLNSIIVDNSTTYKYIHKLENIINNGR